MSNKKHLIVLKKTVLHAQTKYLTKTTVKRTMCVRIRFVVKSCLSPIGPVWLVLVPGFTVLNRARVYVIFLPLFYNKRQSKVTTLNTRVGKKRKTFPDLKRKNRTVHRIQYIYRVHR